MTHKTSEAISQYPLATADIRNTFGHFIPDPYHVITDSAHGVVLGTLQPYGAVAVKPHANFNRAIREASNLGKIAEFGFRAFKPVTVSEGTRGEGYLVTALEKDITNLGQINWHVDIASPKLKHAVDPALDVAGTIAAGLHNKGITVGDFQSKNVMLDSEGRHIFGDAEKTQFNQKGEVLHKQADADLFKFGAGVLVQGLLRDKSPSYRAGYLGDKFVGPYTDETNSKINLIDAEARRTTLEAKWQQYVIDLNHRRKVKARTQGRL